jgi:hypothetical protein
VCRAVQPHVHRSDEAPPVAARLDPIEPNSAANSVRHATWLRSRGVAGVVTKADLAVCVSIACPISGAIRRSGNGLNKRLRGLLTSGNVQIMLTVGEALHDKGRDGARRAKLWLEATTRVSQAWLNTDPVIGARCQFQWPFGGQPFSYDIAGMLRGPDFEGHYFLAECKKYSVIGNQPSEYPEYLAKCYVVYKDQPKWCDHFMWITWHPFNVKTWAELCAPEMVRKAVLGERERVFGVSDEAEAESLIDEGAVVAVAQRLWLLVLTDKQEKLVIPRDHLALIREHEVKRGESS